MKNNDDFANQNSELSLANQAYLQIKRGILKLDFPPGGDLTEAFLAEELSMSRLPISMPSSSWNGKDGLSADTGKSQK